VMATPTKRVYCICRMRSTSSSLSPPCPPEPTDCFDIVVARFSRRRRRRRASNPPPFTAIKSIGCPRRATIAPPSHHLRVARSGIPVCRVDGC
jgi:hypothetical protein